MVASLPVFVKRTTSADGTMRRNRSAVSTSADVAAAKCDPSAIASQTVFTIVAFACPWMSAPNDIMKSIYSLPSISQTRDPLAAFQHDGPGCVHGGSPRWRVYALNQRQLGAFKPFLRPRPASCLHHMRFQFFHPDPANPPPSTTSAVPVTKEDASLAR